MKGVGWKGVILIRKVREASLGESDISAES